MSGIDTFSPNEYYRTDYGTLASGRILQAENEAAGCLNRSADLEAHALELIAEIQDKELWKEHIDINTEEPRFNNFWYGYVEFFVEAYGDEFGIRYGTETIRQRIRMYKNLLGQGYDRDGLMRKVLNLPLAQQQQLEAVVDMRQMEFKGTPDSHEAAAEFVKGVLEGEVAPSSLAQVANGPAVFFRYDNSGIVAVWSSDEGVEEYDLLDWDDHFLPAVVRAAIITKLGAKPKTN